MYDFTGSEWQVGTGEPNGFKSITAFYPEEASTSNGILKVYLLLTTGNFVPQVLQSNYKNNKSYSFATSVSVVITGLGADFTRMESFGKVEEFAETLVRFDLLI